LCGIQNYEGSMPMILHLVALLELGLMCGSELNVALFSHPVLKRQPLETHMLVRSSLAALFGRVMPFWVAGSTLLNLLLLLPFGHLNKSAWRFGSSRLRYPSPRCLVFARRSRTHQQQDC
jgi:hypothetical protein